MFVAINYISCNTEYKARFEWLFKTRARAVDRIPGFRSVQVLKPTDGLSDYLIISHWDSEAGFQEWKNSPEFLEGHRRGFADLAKAKNKGKEPPVKSVFKTYTVITE